ncbi:MAG: hypothetical protein GXW99_01000 [Clostridiales bacterium]|nr:hypothetical protein [Clostridiales bacterium]
MQGYEGTVPVMLEMALQKNKVALNYFMGMPYEEQQHFVAEAPANEDGAAMQDYVRLLTGRIG